jgi:hypothetical protein
MKSQAQLTLKQLKANREAIHNFIHQQSNAAPKGSVILLPEFEENADGSWSPTSHKGARLTKDNSAFVRFGKRTFTNGKFNYLFTNFFSNDGEQELMNILNYLDPSATIGSAIKGVKLVVHESVYPFSRTNPDRDIKWANKDAGIACKVDMVDDQGVVDTKVIYRRVVPFFVNEEGVYEVPTVPERATDQLKDLLMKKTPMDNLIQHTNVDEIADNAIAQYADKRKASEQAAAMLKAKEERLLELQGKANLTDAEAQEQAALVVALGL